MPEIVLTEEQARVLAEATGKVVVRTPGGEAVGEIDPVEAAIIRRWEQRRAAGGGGPAGPAARVEAHLRELQAEWDRTGGLDRAYAVDFLRRLRQRDSA